MANTDLQGPIASITVTGDTAFFTASIMDVSFTYEREAIDITSGDATSGIMQSIPARVASMSLEGTMQWDPAKTPVTIMELAPASTDITFLDDAATVYRFTEAFLTSFAPSLPARDLITASFSMALSGTFSIDPV